jgi:hypothetical protein
MRWIVLLCLLALPVQAEPWIRYGRSGGIAGTIVSLTISKEGAVEYHNDRNPVRTTTLSKTEIKKLCREIPATFPAIKPGPAVPDGINVSLEVDDQKSTWGTGTPMPEQFGPLLEHLSKIEAGLRDSEK